MTGMTTDELRDAVRAVLREVLPAHGTGAAAPLRGPAGAKPVVLRTDHGLDTFVRRLADLCEDPREREALRDCRRRFVLAALAAADSTGVGHGEGSRDSNGVIRIDRGAVTERRVNQAAA